MKKKRALKVGDRVAVYGWSGDCSLRHHGDKGIIVAGDMGNPYVKLDRAQGGVTETRVHPKQCRRLKPKPKPRRRVDVGAFLSSILHGNDGHRQWLTDEFTKAFGPAPQGQFVEVRQKKEPK